MLVYSLNRHLVHTKFKRKEPLSRRKIIIFRKKAYLLSRIIFDYIRPTLYMFIIYFIASFIFDYIWPTIFFMFILVF